MSERFWRLKRNMFVYLPGLNKLQMDRIAETWKNYVFESVVCVAKRQLATELSYSSETVLCIFT